MKQAFFIAFILLIAWSFGSFATEKTCRECDQLARVEARAKRDVLKRGSDLAPYSIEAAQIIFNMSKKSKTLDERRISSVVSVYRTLVPKDSHSVLSLTKSVIADNREAIDAKIATLPVEESKFLMEAIDEAFKVAGAEEEELTEATPPPAPPPTSRP